MGRPVPGKALHFSMGLGLDSLGHPYLRPYTFLERLIAKAVA